MKWIDDVRWDEKGLVPVIAQEHVSNDVLMFAWMNREALQKTAELGRAVYFSRSRNRLWFKGEESGHVQTVHEIRLDCDNDVVLLKVTQQGHMPGIACHTGRHSCFFQLHEKAPTDVAAASVAEAHLVAANPSAKLVDGGRWKVVDPVLKDPQSIYK